MKDVGRASQPVEFGETRRPGKTVLQEAAEPSREAASIRNCYPDETALLACCCTMQSGPKPASWFLTIERRVLADWLTPVERPPGRQRDGDRERLEQHIQQLSAPLKVTLGTAFLNAIELKALRPGDLLVLDQRVEDPVLATVGDARMFLGWPGRCGERQSLEIESLLDGQLIAGLECESRSDSPG